MKKKILLLTGINLIYKYNIMLETTYYNRHIAINESRASGWIDYNSGYNCTSWTIQPSGKIAFDIWFDEATYLKLVNIIKKVLKKIEN